jgi:ABC-type transport system substrate-binding protein
MDRRDWLKSGGAALAAAAGSPFVHAQPRDSRTLRVCFRVAETGFDPPQVGDINSAMVLAGIFEPPLTYDYVARPVKLRPQTAAAMPEISADFTTFTFRIRPGIFFADDPAFKGRPRELVAQDYVYTVKRFYDPRINSEHLYIFENARLLGMSALRERALKAKTPLDYDREVEGIRALDRYTFQVKLAEPNPRMHFNFANPGLTGAVAREVVEAYGDDIAAHPVGTGPFRLGIWRRQSFIELVRNPGFREQVFEGVPTPGDVQAEAIASELAGQRLPRVDRVHISVIIESQPRWLSFVNGDQDVLELPNEYARLAIPRGQLAPHLARKGIKMQSALRSDMLMTFFNMVDPVIGGYTPDKVALRRAVALALNDDERRSLIEHDQAIAAQSVVAPFTSGYDEHYRSLMSEHSVTRARALLDIYGYVDRDGDGFREMPDGRPLLLRLACQPDQRSRAISELWRKQMAAVGLRIRFDVANWPDLLKMSRAGTLMMWTFTWIAESPDGGFFLGLAYSKNVNESNDARFSLPAYDRIFERQKVMPDGPERDAVMREAKNLLAAYMPYKSHSHGIVTDLLQPWVNGYWRHPFMRDLWRYVGLAAL